MKKFISKPMQGLWLLGLAAFMQACYPTDSIPITDLDTVTTIYDSDDFANGAPTSVAIAWDVVELKLDDETDIPYNGEVDDEILNTTLEELVAIYGADSVYIIFDDSLVNQPIPAPSVQVTWIPSSSTTVPYFEGLYMPSIVLNEKSFAYVYPGYPWYGGGWWGWYPGYPCYYCYYPPYVGYQTYEVGTILLEMYDLEIVKKEIESGVPENEINPSWVGAMRGILSSSEESNAARTVSGIQSAFQQSPYLKP